MADKAYQSCKHLLKNQGLLQTINYKLLQARDQHPVFDQIASWFSDRECTGYAGSHIAAFDRNGSLAFFHPSPSYPQDFRPVNLEVGEFYPHRLREPPSEFAERMHYLLHGED